MLMKRMQWRNKTVATVLGQALIRANGVTDSQNIAVVRSRMSPAACRRGEKARVKKAI
jgi:hypothetical protein